MAHNLEMTGLNISREDLLLDNMGAVLGMVVKEGVDKGEAEAAEVVKDGVEGTEEGETAVEGPKVVAPLGHMDPA